MRYRCPKCGRYGMQWDARAKVILCYYNTCNYVIRMANKNGIPTPEEISSAIEKDAEEVQHKTLDDIIPAV
jgi:hypothetical protein